MDLDRLLAEEAGLAQHGDLLDVAGVAQRLLLHVGDVQGARQRAQAVAVEGHQRADTRQVQVFGVGEGRPHHQLAVLHVARRPDVLLDHVAGREDRLVFPGPHAQFGQAADMDQGRVGGVELAVDVADQQVAHARRHAAVDDGRDSLVFCAFVEHERVLGKEGDVDRVAAGLDHGAQGLVAQEAGDGVQGQVVAGDELANPVGVRQVRLDEADRLVFGALLQRLGADVGSRDLEAGVLGQVQGHGCADQPRAEDDYLFLFHRFLLGVNFSVNRGVGKSQPAEAVEGIDQTAALLAAMGETRHDPVCRHVRIVANGA